MEARRPIRTSTVFAALVVAAVLFTAVAHADLGTVSDIAGLGLLFPFFTSALLHKAGVPGVLEHNGACGWGWCSPTVLGWMLTALIWAGAFWLLAMGVARLLTLWRNRKPGSE
jgi:hypothetical protein